MTKSPLSASLGFLEAAMTEYPVALAAALAAPRTKKSNYPEPFASRMEGRVKRPLGDLFGLEEFRRQSDDAHSRRRVRAAPRAHQAGRVRLHPARSSDAGDGRGPHPAEAGRLRGVQGGYRRRPLPYQRDRRRGRLPRSRRPLCRRFRRPIPMTTSKLRSSTGNGGLPIRMGRRIERQARARLLPLLGAFGALGTREEPIVGRFCKDR